MVQISIPSEELRKRRLFIATPMYGGNCAGAYAESVCNLTALCMQHGIEFKRFFMFNESLITRARNYCVDEFLRSGYTHMIFIDSDIEFNPHDVIAMIALMGADTPYDVMAAAYPKKCISWEKVKLAVDKGVADKNPNDLANFVGDFVFNPVVGDNAPTEIQISEPAEISEAGTGFMMIRRSAFRLFDEKFPEYRYKPDHVRSKNFDGTREIMCYFDCEIDPETKRYLSEDYFFCHKLRKAGGKVWLCPWMELKHYGTYTFGGSLAALGSIGAPATVDRSQIENTKK